MSFETKTERCPFLRKEVYDIQLTYLWNARKAISGLVLEKRGLLVTRYVDVERVVSFDVREAPESARLWMIKRHLRTKRKIYTFDESNSTSYTRYRIRERERERVPSEFGGLRRERGGGGKGVAGGRSLGMKGGGSSESEEAPSP